MDFDFGKVIRYNQKRGLGFASHEFRSSSEEVFFHIKILRQSYPALAESLEGASKLPDAFAWYEYRICPRGHEVTSFLTPKKVLLMYPDKVERVIDLARREWLCITRPISKSILAAAEGLLSPEEIGRLSEIRRTEKEKQRALDEKLKKLNAEKAKEAAEKRAAQRKAELEKRQAICNQRLAEEREKEDEFQRLVAEMKPHGFSRSSQVSAHIMRHRLGLKYQHISGVLEMELDGEKWNFNGGFPPDIYARLCDELGLSSKGSLAHPKNFTPFKDILGN